MTINTDQLARALEAVGVPWRAKEVREGEHGDNSISPLVFHYLRPVLLRAGCAIEENSGCTWVENISHCLYLSEKTYPDALAAAILYFADQHADVLARAVQGDVK